MAALFRAVRPPRLVYVTYAPRDSLMAIRRASLHEAGHRKSLTDRIHIIQTTGRELRRFEGVILMTSFTTRVELHQVRRTDYDQLHLEMEQEGFERTISSDDGTDYHLPTAEYNNPLSRCGREIIPIDWL
jgi:hypothetical protein